MMLLAYAMCNEDVSVPLCSIWSLGFHTEVSETLTSDVKVCFKKNRSMCSVK